MEYERVALLHVEIEWYLFIVNDKIHINFLNI